MPFKALIPNEPAFTVGTGHFTFNVFVSPSCPSYQFLTMGCETVDMTLRRNGLGQLGFHVRLDGTVAEVPWDGRSGILGAEPESF